MSHYSFVPGAAALLILAASGPVGGQPSRSSTMDGLAERYVKLVLAVGQHDADYVDAYYGPKEWRDDAARGKEPLPALASRAAQIAAQLDAVNAPGDEMLGLRLEYLRRQVSAVRARLRMLQGERLTFDEESKALYDAVAPTHPESHYQALVQRLEKRFPGQGALVERFDFAVNEQCFQYRECRSLRPFIRARKAVFHVEYHVPRHRFCPTTTRLGFSSMKKHLDLRRWRRPCPSRG